MGRNALRFVLWSFLLAGRAHAEEGHWVVPSSNQEQTYAYGSESHHQWINRSGHLALYVEFTNDPYVDRINTRQYDDFEFEFPSIRLGADGRTFYLRPFHEAAVPVAAKRSGQGIGLLASSLMTVRKVHGIVTIILSIKRNSGSP